MEVILAKLLQPDSDVIKQVHGFLEEKIQMGWKEKQTEVQSLKCKQQR